MSGQRFPQDSGKDTVKWLDREGSAPGDQLLVTLCYVNGKRRFGGDCGGVVSVRCRIPRAMNNN